ncbi:30S ribosomal protein S8e [Halomicroarcula sp. GCM10025710]
MVRAPRVTITIARRPTVRHRTVQVAAGTFLGYERPGTLPSQADRRSAPAEPQEEETRARHGVHRDAGGRPELKVVDSRGNTSKVRAVTTDVASVADGAETVEATIENVVENPSNPNYARRNIITKGALVETSEGTARVTSRPGQDGQVNAVLEEE